MTDGNGESDAAISGRKWRPLNATERRVLGVLVEKAKTTPDAYPLTINALTSGCNQKSNRFPQTSLASDDVEEALETLREAGAATEVLASGRSERYKHYIYEWLGVDKIESGVMAELLLRGAQTIGELRGRAARMADIPDLAALKPVLDSLQGKGLVVALSEPGRGQVVTHALYTPREMERVRAEYASGASAPAASIPRPTSGATDSRPAPSPGELESLRAEVAQLRSEVDELRAAVDDLKRLAAGTT